MDRPPVSTLNCHSNYGKHTIKRFSLSTAQKTLTPETQNPDSSPSRADTTSPNETRPPTEAVSCRLMFTLNSTPREEGPSSSVAQANQS